MAADCVFCSIVAGNIPATIVYDDEHAVAFVDVDPKAPTHLLVVSRTHYRDLAALSVAAPDSAALLRAVVAVARTLGLDDYRTVFNSGQGAGQTVFHVHAHVLAGRAMTWPPG